MHLSEIVKVLKSNNISSKVQFLNKTVYVTKLDLNKDSWFINLGVTFFTKNGREFDLFYDWGNKEIVKQPVPPTYMLDRILGLIYKLNDNNQFIGVPTNRIVTGVSNNSEFLKLFSIADDFELSNFLLEKKVVCHLIGNNSEPFDVELFSVFDADTKQTLLSYPLTFKSFDVFYNEKKDKYEELLDLDSDNTDPYEINQDDID